MGVILAQVQRALGVSAYEAFGHRIDPLSVTRIAAADAPTAVTARAAVSARAAAHGWRVEAINWRS